MAVSAFALAVQPVEADGEATIEITTTDNITLALSPDEAQPQTGTLTVTTTNADGKSWSVMASDNDTANTNGHMTKWSENAYVLATKLFTPMEVQGPTGTVTLPVGGVIVSGSDNVTSQPYTVTFKQVALWTDSVVVSPDCYRIVVTFTGSFTP